MANSLIIVKEIHKNSAYDFENKIFLAYIFKYLHRVRFIGKILGLFNKQTSTYHRKVTLKNVYS